MNVEWWGGEQSSPPADCKSALRPSFADCLLSVFICVHLWFDKRCLSYPTASYSSEPESDVTD